MRKLLICSLCLAGVLTFAASAAASAQMPTTSTVNNTIGQIDQHITMFNQAFGASVPQIPTVNTMSTPSTFTFPTFGNMPSVTCSLPMLNITPGMLLCQ